MEAIAVTSSEYELWEAAHILATGANGSQLHEMLEANRTTFAGMGATYVELCECTERIIESGNKPNWPNEHIAALVNQLRTLREEREKAARTVKYGGGNYSFKHEAGCDCPNCNGGEVLPSYDARRRDLESARAKLQDYILANGGTLQAERIKKSRRKKP